MTNKEMKEALVKKYAELKKKAGKINLRNVGAGLLTGVMLATGGAGNTALASVPESAMEETTHDADAQLARTRADWAKLFEDYRRVDCNLNVNEVEAMLEIEEFIDAHYQEESYGFLIDNQAADNLLRLRHANVEEFGFARMLVDWKNLNVNDKAAVKEFLTTYGPYLAEIHAHNYFTLITIASNIQNYMAYYVKQDLEDATELKAEYAFGQKHFNGGEIAPDLSSVKLYYNDGDTKYNVVVNIVDSLDMGAGLSEIQSVYFEILREVAAMEELMVNGNATENTATYETYGIRAYTLSNGTQVYEIIHNDRINELIRRAVGVCRKFNPAEAYQEELANGQIDGVTVTQGGYGHYFKELGDIQIADNYDASTDTHNCEATEVFELPQIELDRMMTLR